MTVTNVKGKRYEDEYFEQSKIESTPHHLFHVDTPQLNFSLSRFFRAVVTFNFPLDIVDKCIEWSVEIGSDCISLIISLI